LLPSTTLRARRSSTARPRGSSSVYLLAAEPRRGRSVLAPVRDTMSVQPAWPTMAVPRATSQSWPAECLPEYKVKPLALSPPQALVARSRRIPLIVSRAFATRGSGGFDDRTREGHTAAARGRPRAASDSSFHARIGSLTWLRASSGRKSLKSTGALIVAVLRITWKTWMYGCPSPSVSSGDLQSL